MRNEGFKQLASDESMKKRRLETWCDLLKKLKIRRSAALDDHVNVARQVDGAIHSQERMEERGKDLRR